MTATADQAQRERRIIFAVAAIAFLVKLFLAIKTYGTNDVYTYERFGLWSRYFGADLYNIAPDLNHPPSMLHALSFLVWLSEHTTVPFQFWIRIPCILADAGSVWMLCRILGGRVAERPVFIAVLLIAAAPTAILISGFHGNTDPVMIFFVLAAVWLLGTEGKTSAAGAAFGLAMCVKIVPAILIPALFLYLPDLRKRILFFVTAAAVAVAAWSPYIEQKPAAIVHQVFGYKSSYGLWGFSWLFRQIGDSWPRFHWLNDGFHKTGTPLLLGAIVTISLWTSKAKPQQSLYSRVGLIFMLFFALTTGFAVQYLAWLTPWLAELGIIPVAFYLLTGGVFLLVVYNYWCLGMPWYLAIAYPWFHLQYFQALCWLAVLLMIYAAWRRIRRGDTLRLGSALRLKVAAGLAVVLLIYPAIVKMRRDTLGNSPVYAHDIVVATEADYTHNLASLLERDGRRAEASALETKASQMDRQSLDLYAELVRKDPARRDRRTPEDILDLAEKSYYAGEFADCVAGATESLKFRHDVPGAWDDISFCNASLGYWDAAIYAAQRALRSEPEDDQARQNLDWAISQKRASGGLSK